MVLQLSEALDVPLRERNQLLRSAGFADAYAGRDLGAPDLAGIRRGLELVLTRYEPYPVFAMDGGWNVLLANEAAMRLVLRLVGVQEPPFNLMRLLFGPGRPFVENWNDVAWGLIQRLHRDAARGPEGSPLRALLAEIIALPDLPRALTAGTPGRFAPPVVPVILQRGDERLSLLSLITTFGTPLDVTLNELRIETFLPADDETEAALHALRNGD